MLNEVEKAFLGCLIIADYEKQLEIISEVTAEDFTSFEFKKLYMIAVDLLKNNKKQIDSVTLYAGGFKNAKLLAELGTEVTSASQYEHYLHILKEATYKRQLIALLENTLKSVKDSQYHDDREEAKEKLIHELNIIQLDNLSPYVDLDFYKEKILEQINKTDTLIEGFSFGIPSLDIITSGVILSRLYVIGALKKSGKSRFSVSTIKHLYLQNVKTGFISLEMPPYEVSKCLYACLGQLNDFKLRSGSLISNIEKCAFQDLKIDQNKIFIDCTPRRTASQIRSRLRVMKNEGVQVVFIDYLQRIVHNKNRDAQELEEISNIIADATREEGIAIILLSQMQNIAENEIPTIGHLKGSGGIGESADTILLLDNIARRTHKDTDKGNMDIYVEQRYGDSGKVELLCDLGTLWFGDRASDMPF